MPASCSGHRKIWPNPTPWGGGLVHPSCFACSVANPGMEGEEEEAGSSVFRATFGAQCDHTVCCVYASPKSLVGGVRFLGEPAQHFLGGREDPASLCPSMAFPLNRIKTPNSQGRGWGSPTGRNCLRVTLNTPTSEGDDPKSCPTSLSSTKQRLNSGSLSGDRTHDLKEPLDSAFP